MRTTPDEERNFPALNQSAGGPARRRRARWRAGLVAVAIALILGVAAAVALQVQIARTDAEFLTRPVPLGPGSELIAARLPRRTLGGRSDTLNVTLYVRGMLPSSIQLAVIPAAFTVPQLAPDLSERSLSTSGLGTRVETVMLPPFARHSPGTYALHVVGSPVTFGVFSVAG